MQAVKKESARMVAHPDAQRKVKHWLLDAFSLPHGRGAVKGLWYGTGAVIAAIAAAGALDGVLCGDGKFLSLALFTLFTIVFAVLVRRTAGGGQYGRQNHH